MMIENNVPPQIPQPALTTPQPKSVWGPWPSIGFSLVILIVFLVAQIIVIAVPAISALVGHTGTAFSTPEEITKYITDQLNLRLGLYQSIATIVSGIAGVLMIWVFVNARKGLGLMEYLGVKKVRIRTLVLSAVIIIAAIALAVFIQSLIGVTGSEPVMEKIFKSSVIPWLLWVSVIVFAPLFEEALFRGFLFEGILRSWGVFAAVMLTSFGWAVLHGAQYGVEGVTYIFYLGLVMGLVRWKSGSIWTTFTMHAIVNLIAMIAMTANWNI